MLDSSELNAVVFGLGAIGAGYDLYSKNAIYSHARAYHKHPGFNLLGGIEQDIEKQQAFSSVYELPVFDKLSDFLADGTKLDIVSICTPTELHEQHLDEILTLKPSVVLCEKPIAYDLEQASRMVERCKSESVILAVNFWRRTEPGVRVLKHKFDAGLFGRLSHGCVWYQRGVLNNASHFIDLLIYLLGEPSDICLTDKRNFHEKESFEVYWDTSIVEFRAVDDCEFNFFEMNLVCEKGIVEYKNAGREIIIRLLEEEAASMGHQQLGKASIVEDTDFDCYQFYAMDNIYKHITKGEALLLSGLSGLASLNYLSQIKN